MGKKELELLKSTFGRTIKAVRVQKVEEDKIADISIYFTDGYHINLTANSWMSPDIIEFIDISNFENDEAEDI